MEGEGTLVQVLVIGDGHAAVTGSDRLVRVEAEGTHVTDGADWPSLVSRAESLGAVLDQPQSVLVRDGAQFIQPGRVAHHVHGDDCLGPRGDLGFDVDRIEVEGLVHFSQHWNRAAVDDGRNTRDECVTGDDDFVTRADAQSAQRDKQCARSRVDRHAVFYIRELADFILEFDNLLLEVRIFEFSVAIEPHGTQYVHHFLNFFFSDQFHSWSWHFELLLSLSHDVVLLTATFVTAFDFDVDRRMGSLSL